MRRYRFGFVLSAGAGNRTRFENLKKYTERDASVGAVWAPHPGPIENDRLGWLPPTLGLRRTALHHAAPVLKQLGQLDAVMFHAFDAYVLAALRNLLAARPAIVWSQDDPPSRDPEFWKHYGLTNRPRWRAQARFRVDAWCTKRVSLFLPFSRWVGDELIRACSIPPALVEPVNVGVDLELWRYTPPKLDVNPKILFVGSAFERKGGKLLVDIFRRKFVGQAELHIVSPAETGPLPDGAFVHKNLTPNDEPLRKLFAEASFLVLPTRSDMVPNVILEAMASGAAVIATRVGGIPDLVTHDQTGLLVDPDDAQALAEAMLALLEDPEKSRRMGAAGRARVEADFSAALNVPRILSHMKRVADELRT